MSRGTSWLGLLRERAAFRRLWLADVVSLLGDWLTYVAVSLLALERGEGLVAVSLVLVAHALPSTLLAPFAGWFIDRWDRRRVLVVTNLARGGLALGMAYAAAVGSLGGVQLLLLVRIALAAFSDPAVTASLPKVLADPDSAASSDALSSNATAPRSARLLADLGAANRLIGATWSVLFALGVAAGGVAAAFLGPTYAILLDAGTFFLAAWIARGLPRLEPEQNAERGGTLFGELFAALVHVKGDRRILEAALAKAPAAIVNGGGWVLLNERAQSLGAASWFGATALFLGALQCVRAFGTGVGPVLWARWSPDDRSAWWWNATTWSAFVGVAALALAPSAAWLAVAVFVWGIGVGANWVAATTRLQRLAPDHLLGRLAALDLFGHTLGQCAGALLGAIVAQHFARPSASAWTGVVLGVSAWLMLKLLGQLAHSERSSPEAATQTVR